MNRKPVATYIILGINLVAFTILAFNQWSIWFDTDADVLAILRAGANLNPYTLGGQPWRIVTSMFLHFGIFHLAVNMYALYTIGIVLEPVIGTTRYTLVYLICGLVAGLASLLLNVYVISAGASGALFGLYGYRLGAEIVSTFDNRNQLKDVLKNFVIFILINGYIAFKLNVDIWGHVGGCIAGLILGVMHFRFRILINNLHLAIAVLPVAAAMWLLPGFQLDYYRIFQRVIQNERRTNAIYSSGLTDLQIADTLVDINTTWDSIQSSLNSLTGVPEVVRQDTAIMRKYVRIHQRETSYRILLVRNESYVYIDSLEHVNKLFDSVSAFTYRLNYEPSPAIAVEQDSVAQPAYQPRRIFYDHHWKEIDDPSDAAYYRVGQIDSAGRWQGPVRDYYRNGNVQMKGTYKDNMKNGIFIYYSDHSTYTSAGRYDHEEAIGKWETFYHNGKLHEEIYYADQTFVKSVFDSLGNAQVSNGNGKVTEWYSNGQVSQSGEYINGRKTGDWYGYHRSGTAYFREAYHDNKLLKGVSFDEAGKKYVYDELSIYAYPVNGMEGFKNYLRQRIDRVNVCKASGIVKLVFNVGETGDMWDFVVMQGISPACDQEAIRLVREGPRWRTGLMHGHVPMPSQGYAEVQF